MTSRLSIEFVFLDIDGTMVYDRKLVPSVRDAVDRLAQNGIGVALCTGRSILQTRSLHRQLQLRYGVYFNGALTIADSAVIAQKPLPQAVVRRARTFFQGRGLPVVFHGVHESFTSAPLPPALTPILKAYDYPVAHVRADNQYHDREPDVFQANVFMTDIWDVLVQHEFPECLLYRWHEQAIDLQNVASDKSVGAVALLAHLGIHPDNAVHFGDAGNDIGMFETVGMSVAMGNATDAIKKTAKRQTAAVYEDGVHKGLRALGLI